MWQLVSSILLDGSYVRVSGSLPKGGGGAGGLYEDSIAGLRRECGEQRDGAEQGEVGVFECRRGSDYKAAEEG